MNSQIVAWCKKVCKKYGMSSFYIPNKDLYMIHFQGKAIQGFNSFVFYEQPKEYREKQLLPILKLGLMNNFNLNNRETLYTQRKKGKVIVA